VSSSRAEDSGKTTSSVLQTTRSVAIAGLACAKHAHRSQNPKKGYKHAFIREGG
jgi:uncharacterized Zn-binding protein involved in type VI secretion